MNKENAHKYLPLVQALADGKTIQHKSFDDHWIDIDDHKIIYFHEPSHYYRIKPEPRTFEVWLTLNGHMYPAVPAVDWALQNDTWERITVQEVLE
jgi:hypothetical protein